MRRRLLGTLLWFILLLLVGSVRILFILLRAAVGTQRLLVLGGLAVVLSSAGAVAAQFSEATVRLLEHVIVAWVLPALGAVVLYHGFRSREVRAIRRRLRHRGWC